MIISILLRFPFSLPTHDVSKLAMPTYYLLIQCDVQWVTLSFLGPCAVVVGAAYLVFDVLVFPIASDIPQYPPTYLATSGVPEG